MSDLDIPFLAALPPDAAEAVRAQAERRCYAAGRRLVTELEAGDEVFILLSGRAGVTVGAGEAGEERLGELGPGAVVGEVALVTGSLRSASVTALEPVETLVLARARVEELLARFPSLARYLLQVLAARLSSADAVLARALHPEQGGGPPLEALAAPERRIAAHRRSLASLLRRAFAELVVEHRHEIPFALLATFVGAVAAARLGIRALHELGLPILPLLRTFYVAGLLGVIVSAGAALMVFGRRARLWLAILFGACAGLVANELSVLLAFDVFYQDVFTRDPRLHFDAALLYRRSESVWVVVMVGAALLQATYFRKFYRRAVWLLLESWRGGRRGGPEGGARRQ